MRRLVFDLDDVLESINEKDSKNINLLSNEIAKYKKMGFVVVFATSAGVPDYDSDHVRARNKDMSTLQEALVAIGIDYDEIVTGRPAAGRQGLVLDDKAVTMDEFFSKDYAAIRRLVNHD